MRRIRTRTVGLLVAAALVVAAPGASYVFGGKRR